MDVDAQEARDEDPDRGAPGGPLENRRPQIDYHEGTPDPLHDPRTEEDWFKRLDPIVQSDFATEWRVARQHELNRGRIRKESLARGWKEGIVVFFVCNTLFALFWMSLARTLLAIVFGYIVGRIWHRIQAGRFQAMAVGMPFQLLLVAMAGMPRSIPDGIHLFMNPLAFMALAGIVGASREFRKADGSEH